LQIEPLARLGETLQTITNRRLELSNLLAVMQNTSGATASKTNRDIRFVALKVPADEAAVDQAAVDQTAADQAAADQAAADQAAVASVDGTALPAGLIPRLSQQSSVPHELVTIQEELSRARTSAQQLSAHYGAKHPDVQLTRAQVTAWEDRLSEYLASAPAMLKQELEAIQRQEQQIQELYQSELAKAKAVDSYLIREQQELDGITRVQTMHSSLLAQLQQWQLSEQALANGRSRVTFRVLEEPIAPEDPTWPEPKLVLAVSLVIGLCGGLGLAVVIGPAKPAIQGTDNLT
jgi:uncharacterized protein involved in exopolysaccharide biosynthesis